MKVTMVSCRLGATMIRIAYIVGLVLGLSACGSSATSQEPLVPRCPVYPCPLADTCISDALGNKSCVQMCSVRSQCTSNACAPGDDCYTVAGNSFCGQGCTKDADCGDAASVCCKPATCGNCINSCRGAGVCGPC
jgi:hypothetical protein